MLTAIYEGDQLYKPLITLSIKPTFTVFPWDNWVTVSELKVYECR